MLSNSTYSPFFNRLLSSIHAQLVQIFVIYVRQIEKKRNRTVGMMLLYNSTNPDAGYPEFQLSGSARTFGEICREFYKKLTCLDITGYRIKYSTVLWLLELQIRRVRKV
jgi:hypothetical protein